MHLRHLLCLPCLAMALLATPAAAHQHAPLATPAAAAHAYATDAALRDAMSGVRNAVEAFAHARHGHMGRPQVLALADHLDSQVARVFRDCRLAPDADAAMHPLLMTILDANRALRATPGDFAPVDTMNRALADYARLFDDSGARAPSQP